MAEPTLKRRAVVKRYKAKRLASGRCVSCPRPPVLGRTCCRGCMRKRSVATRRRQREWAAAGVCSNCGKEKTDPTMCLDCRLKTVARLRYEKAVSSGVWLVLKKKWEDQGGRCVYSGEAITPGVNASIDHIVPKSRGGGDEPANLQWVSLRVNKMKGDMLHDEFLSMCRLIAGRGANG